VTHFEAGDAVGVLGLNPTHPPMYRALGYRTGELTQWLAVASGKNVYGLPQELLPRPETLPLPVLHKGEAGFSPWTGAEHLSMVGWMNGEFKTAEYFSNRYLKHPIYKYLVFTIRLGESNCGLIAMRMARALQKNVLRIVDFAGEPQALAKIGTALTDLMSSLHVEYVDIWENGPLSEALIGLGMAKVSSLPGLVAPNFFEPFVAKTGKIEFAVKGFENLDYAILRGDGDQDRPSKIESSGPEMVFTLKDQEVFARLSGDFNPIHLDPIYARRSPFGVVAHGIHVLLWALEQFVSQNPALLRQVSAVFLKPVRLLSKCSLNFERGSGDGQWRINVYQAKAIAATFRVKCDGTSSPPPPVELQELNLSDRSPQFSTFDQLKDARGTIKILGSRSELTERFPNLTRSNGTVAVAALSSLSRLVGMICPGMNSLFSGLDVTFSERPENSIEYEVQRHRSEQAPLKMGVQGALIGEVSAFYRPSPVVQTHFSEFLSRVETNEFESQKVLVVGGSRGLGEVTAKLLAAGGAHVTVTYVHGQKEAAELQAQIGADHCDIQQLDVLKSADLAGLQQRSFDQIYYFPTPMIRANTSNTFDQTLYEQFKSYYVDAFAELMRVLVKKSTKVFYPSSVFLDENPSGFKEYVAAKLDGERLVQTINKEMARAAIAVVRLPKMMTDQTNSVVSGKTDANWQVMLSAIRNNMK
jgi:hypothetical protein